MTSIEERANGPRVVWRLNRPGDPAHQTKQHLECDTDENAFEAQKIIDGHSGRLTREEAELLILGPAEEPSAPAAPTFGAWTTEWLADKTRISPRTRRDYRQILDYRVLPAPEDLAGSKRFVGGWCGRQMDDFLPKDITKYLNGLRGDGLSSATITKHYAVISGAFAAAVNNKIIDENPCDGTDFVRDQTDHDDTGDEDHVYLSPQEWQVLYRNFPAFYRPFVESLVASGLRFSECTALQVCDVISPTRRDPFPRLHIRRAWKKGDAGQSYLGTTKGRQRRKNRIDGHLAQMLVVQGRSEHGLSDRPAAPRASDALLFVTPSGNRITYDNFLSRVWNRAVVAAMRCPEHLPAPQASSLAQRVGVCGDHGGISRKTGGPCGKELVAGLDRCVWHAGVADDAVSDCDCPDVLHRRPTPHDLRHTCVAWMFEDPSVAPLYISRYVGHASLEVTDKVYAGLMPSGEGAAVLAIETARGRSSIVPVAALAA